MGVAIRDLRTPTLRIFLALSVASAAAVCAAAFSDSPLTMVSLPTLIKLFNAQSLAL